MAQSNIVEKLNMAAPYFFSTPSSFRMSSIQEQLEALREEKENVIMRIAELERAMQWDKEKEVRCAELRHKEDLVGIARLRTDAAIVVSNPALVKLLDGMTSWGGGTPHSQGRAWACCGDGRISMLNVNNGISMPALGGKTWPDGAFSMSGVFSHSSLGSDGPSGINYPKGTMIDFNLVYPDGIALSRKGLVLKEGAILQLLPEKKVYTSLGAWIVDLAQPTFGAVRVRLPDPRTRHEKAQDEVNKLESFEQKIAYLTQQYNLKPFASFGYSPKQLYENAVRRMAAQQEQTKLQFAELNLGAPGAGEQLIRLGTRMGTRMKRLAAYRESLRLRVEGLSEEDRNKEPVQIFNPRKSFLFIKNAVYGRCTVAMPADKRRKGIYHQAAGGGAKEWVPQGPTQVFLSWRGKEIVFEV